VNVAAAEWLVCDLDLAINAADCAAWADCPLGYAAAAAGCLRRLQHLCEKGLYSPCASTMRAVLAQGGDSFPLAGTRYLEVCWLHSRGVATYGPALGFELRTVLPAHHPAIPKPEFLTTQAARVGALELLQILVE
jgi:hypothetical protein